MKRHAVNIMLALGSLLLVIAVIELALRFTDYRYLLVDSYLRFPVDYFQRDSELGVDQAPNRTPDWFQFRGPGHETFTNSLGCFDHERPISDDYWLVAGDSNAWGWVPLEDMWTARLEQQIGKPVVKCAVAGTGPKFQLVKIRKVIEQLARRPKVIILSYSVANDFNDDVVFPGYALIDGHRVSNMKRLDLRSGQLSRLSPDELSVRFNDAVASRAGYNSRLVAQSVVAALIDHAYATNRQRVQYSKPKGPILSSRYAFNLLNVDPQRYPWVEVAFEEHLENLRRFARFAEENEAKLVLVSLGYSDSELSIRLRNFFERELTYYLDANIYKSRNKNGKETHHRFDMHSNEWGNRLTAEGIYQYLQRAGLLGEN